MKKRITTIFLSLLLALTMITPIDAVAAGSGIHFRDELGEIKDTTMFSDLNDQADAIYENTGYQVLFVTMKVDEEDDLTAILDTTYQSWNGETPGIGVIVDQNGYFGISYYGVAGDNLSSDQKDAIFDTVEHSGSIQEAAESVFGLAEEDFGALEPVEKIPLPVGGKATTDEGEKEVPAEEAPVEEKVQETGIRLVDMAGLLNEEEQQNLLTKLDGVSAKHNMDIIVVTTNDLEGKEPKAYAEDYFGHNGYSKNGVLLLVSVDGGNNWHMSTRGTAIDIFNEDAREYMSNGFVECFSDGEFMDGFLIYADRSDEILTMAENGKTYKHKPGFKAILYSVGIGFVLAFVMAMYKKSQMKSIVAQQSAQDYTKAGSVQLHAHYDNFINRTTTSRVIHDDNDRDSGSSGGDYGGSGGSF